MRRCHVLASIFACSGRILIGLGLALTSACSDSDATQESATDRTNLILISLDTLRPDHLGCYGYDKNTSPNIDAFAAESFVFHGAQSAAPWTAPSMVSMMTSLYPDVHQITRFPRSLRLGDGVETLAERLQLNGYETAAFTEGGYLSKAIGLDQGFDIYQDQPSEKPGKRKAGQYPLRLEKGVQRFVAWLSEREGTRPFFGFFQTYEPHQPLVAPEKYIQMFAPEYDQAAEHARLSAIITDWANGKPFDVADGELIQKHVPHCKLAGLGKVERLPEFVAHGDTIGRPMRGPDLSPGSEFSTWLNALYDAEVRYTDDRLGLVFDELERSGRLADTLVLIVSDHGEGLGDHDEIGHGRGLYSEILDVVFVLRLPGSTGPNTPAPGIVRTIDLVPTIYELLDIVPGDAPLQGRSLAPMLAGEQLPELPSFSHAMTTVDQQYSVRLGEWRLIVDAKSVPLGLFNLKLDPKELTDLSASEPAKLDELLELLRSQRERDSRVRQELGVAPEQRDLNMERLRELGYVGDEDH